MCRGDDALVPGAPAKVPGQALAYLVVGGMSRSSAVSDMTKPGVQKPHCSPWHSRSAACTGDNVPSGDAMPSTVLTSMPSACIANIRHDRTASPSRSWSSSWTATSATRDREITMTARKFVH
jgi:hypothetical protein